MQVYFVAVSVRGIIRLSLETNIYILLTIIPMAFTLLYQIFIPCQKLENQVTIKFLLILLKLTETSFSGEKIL